MYSTPDGNYHSYDNLVCTSSPYPPFTCRVMPLRLSGLLQVFSDLLSHLWQRACSIGNRGWLCFTLKVTEAFLLQEKLLAGHGVVCNWSLKVTINSDIAFSGYIFHTEI